jgi:hypothetical protein
MPPSQIMKPRQILIEGGRRSRPESTVAPLAVSPDAASKYASVNDRSGNCRSSGSVANPGNTVHTSATRRKPSRTCNSRPARCDADQSPMPAAAVAASALACAQCAPSARASEKPSGTSMQAANRMRTSDSRCRTASSRTAGAGD